MEEFGDEFSSEGLNDRFRDMEKQMLKIDASRGGIMALQYDEFVEIFGDPNDEDLYDLTQAYIKLYMKQGDDECIPFIVDMYGEEWIMEFLRYNERVEEYELCGLLKSHLDIYKKVVKTSY